MPAETQSLEKFMGNSENLYEAVMIVARRARQINEEQYQRMRDKQILEELDGEFEEEFLNLEEEKNEAEEPVEPEENPIVSAQKEFLGGKIHHHYESTK